MAYQILSTKLYNPPLQAHFVPRSALIQRLERGVQQCRRLTLVSAPAGFGKSTLVSGWMASSEPPKRFGWVSLDAGDNDPVRFLVYLVAALQRADGTLGQDALASLQSPALPPLPEIVEALINEIAAAASPVLLVLDDYHLVKNREVHALTQLVLERQPASLHTVIMTREDPPLPLPRMRVHRQLTEIRERDLRFTGVETALFFQQTMGLRLAEAAVAALERQTEGWVAGLQLAAIALQEYADEQGVQAFVTTFAGNDRYITDYLVSEVLLHQPEAVRTFLIATSILERMCGPLCDAVLGDAATPGQSRAVLDELERANMFLIPLDNRREWYRYHHLFAELLQHTLDQTPGPEPATLHRRASAWYEQHGFLPEAVAHAFNAQDWSFAAELIERQAMTMIGQSQVALLKDWIERCPEPVVQARPGLGIFLAWTVMLTFRTDYRPLVLARLQQAEQALEAQEHPPLAAVGQGGALVPLRAWVTGQAAALRSQLLLAAFHEPVDPHELTRLSHESLRLLPAVEKTIRAICAGTLAMPYLMVGDTTQAHTVFGASMPLCLEAGNYFTFENAFFYQARIAYITGQLERGLEICRDGLAQITPVFKNPEQEFPAIRGLYVMQGIIALERNQLAEAERLLGLGTNRAGYAPWVEVVAYEALIRLCDMRGDAAKVSASLTRMATMGTQIAACGEALRFRHLTSREPKNAQVRASAQAWAEVQAPNLATSLVVDGIGPYQLDAEYVLLKAWLWVQIGVGNAPEALRVVAPILASAQAKGFTQRIIELVLVKAVALDDLGERPAALEALTQALTIAEPGGQIAVFHQGPRLTRLLIDAQQQSLASAYLTHVLTELALLPEGEHESPAARDQVDLDAPRGAPRPSEMSAPEHTAQAELVDPLSERELEVLRLLAQGLTLAEVAERLYLSPHTIKAHTQNIYAKLEVHGRIEAVNRARALGLIP
jgi:LuxR family maltose regulon positive regulatory protein